MLRSVKKPLLLIVVFCAIALIAIMGLRRNSQTPLTLDRAENVFAEMEDTLNEIAAYLVASPSAETLYLRKAELENYPQALQTAVEDYYKALGSDSLITYTHTDGSDIITFPLRSYDMGQDEEGALIYITQYFVYVDGPLPEEWAHRLYVAIKSDTRGTWQLNEHWLFASLRD